MIAINGTQLFTIVRLQKDFVYLIVRMEHLQIGITGTVRLFQRTAL
jgi:hypothetical protein